MPELRAERSTHHGTRAIASLRVALILSATPLDEGGDGCWKAAEGLHAPLPSVRYVYDDIKTTTRVKWQPVLEHAVDIVREYDTPVTVRQLFYPSSLQADPEHTNRLQPPDAGISASTT